MSKEYALRLWQEVGAAPGGETYAVYDCHGLHLHMHYDEGGDALLIYVHLGFLPEHPARQTYEYILELNFLGAGLGGGHVGLHAGTRALVYSLRLEIMQQNALSLQNALHLFAGYALHMLEVKRRGRLAAGKGEADAQENATPATAGTTRSAPFPATDKGIMWG